MWKVGKNLITGQFSDLMKMSTPAFIHQEKSYLHMVCKDISFYEHFLARAMERPDDPIWKLKNLVMGVLAALHTTVENGTKSPLNPILGETLIQQSAKGTRVYCE